MFAYTTPEKAGVRSEGIIRFLDDMKAKRLHMHAMMILRHGEVIAEASFAPWSGDNLHMLFSLSKSFTSTAVGFAVQDGLLRVTDRLVDFFPDLLPAQPCENMQKMTLKHLLTMNTGHGEEPRWSGENWEKVFLRSYVEYEPGTHFLYNTFATYMLA
ncbi:MAG: beta-lactamase family protein, partial [Clostridia bacterium]|nr:beta-lactamase family protein [Clostridia bacterium]